MQVVIFNGLGNSSDGGTLVSEPMTVDESVEKLRDSIAGLGQALTLALVPAIGAIQSVAYQMAVEVEALNIALINSLPSFDWDKLERTMTMENPERWEYESLVDWGNRLERAGLLDKYEYRLMYGKECWCAILWSPFWYAGGVWAWLRYEAWGGVRGLWTKS